MQTTATRKYDAGSYGTSGRFYYHWAALRCVFKTDYPRLTFNPVEGTEELTLAEYVELWFKYESSRVMIGKEPEEKEMYYYVNSWNEVWKQDTPYLRIHLYGGGLELTVAEYIDLSLMWGQNPEDTLI